MSDEDTNEPVPDENVPNIITDRVSELACGQCGCKIDVSEIAAFSKVECPDCHNIETIPARLGHFLLLSLLGTGGMGGVYYAKDESLGRFVAIKVMLESLGKDKEFIETFKREAQAVAKLNHPNIAQIYSFGTEKDQPYIVMELVGGQRFDKMIGSGEALDQGLVMKIGLEIAEALSAADEIGLIHGDIKPENILLDDKWKAKLVDFGLARFVGQATDDGIWGTPYYIAPEKVRRQKVDARSDIYSLGATLYHALVGRPPFEGKTPIDVVKARLNKDPEPLHFYRKDTNDEVETIVMRMLQSQPARRYPTYSSLISDLRSIVKTLGADKPNYAASLNRKTVKLLVSKPKKASSRLSFGKSSKNMESSARSTGSLKGKKITVTVGSTRNVDEATALENPPDIEESTLEEYRKKTLMGDSAGRKSASKGVGGILWVILTIAVIGIGIGVARHLAAKREKEMIRRNDEILRQGQVKTANDTYAKIHIVATNILATELLCREYETKASNAVSGVLREIPKPAAPETPPAAKAPAPASEKAADMPADGRDAPVGILTPEQLQRRKAAAAAAKAGKPAEPAKAQPQPAKPQPAAPQQPEEPEIVKSYKRLVTQTAIASKQAEIARQTDAEALTVKNETARAASGTQAQTGAQKLSEFLITVNDANMKVRECLDDAEAALNEVLAIKARIDKEKELADVRRLREKEEAEKKLKEAETKGVADAEIKQAEQAWLDLNVSFAQHKYKEAAQDLDVRLSSYRTEGGKNAMKLLIEKCEKLDSLKSFVISRLKGGYPWGYVDGASTIDVLTADDKEVKLRTKSVPWTSVSPAQMKKFVDLALGNDQVPARTRAEHTIYAAIFAEINGWDKVAKSYADKAVELAPTLRDEVARLLPKLQ